MCFGAMCDSHVHTLASAGVHKFYCQVHLFLKSQTPQHLLIKPLSFSFFFLFLSRLAESRTNPQVLDIGVNPQDINTEVCLSPGKWDQEDTDLTAQNDTFGL